MVAPFPGPRQNNSNGGNGLSALFSLDQNNKSGTNTKAGPVERSIFFTTVEQDGDTRPPWEARWATPPLVVPHALPLIFCLFICLRLEFAEDVM